MPALKKKPLANKSSLAAAAAAVPRAVAPETSETGRASTRAFPTAFDVLHAPDLAAIIRCAVRAVACAGVVVSSTTVLGGCHEPECEASRLGELEAHGDQALDAVLDLRFRDSVDQLGYGTGIASHPSYYSMPMAGAMPATSYLPPSTGGGEGDVDGPVDFGDLVDSESDPVDDKALAPTID